MAITKATASSIAPAAKGDLVVGSATNDAAVLGVGSNDQVLTADSSTATGLKWAALPSSNPTTASAAVSTSESTSSNTFTNLTTTGPSVTLTTGTKVLVIVSCRLDSSPNEDGNMGYEVSGSTTTAASATTMLAVGYEGSVPTKIFTSASRASIITVNAGSNTFTAKYRSPGFASRTFSNREIFVMNLS